MSETNVLYDAPGPRARRNARIGGAVAAVLLAGLAWVVISRLNEQGQFSGELWGPVLDPSNEDFASVWRLLRDGALATLRAAVLAITFSLVFGTLIGVLRMMLGRWGRMPLVGMIELLRGLPVVISIYFASRVLPQLGVDLSFLPWSEGLWYLVIGLTAYNSVIIAEILRAGVASLPRGQDEAAMSLGMARWQSMRMILLPQAIRIMLPALISQIVVILKDTSLAAVLGLYTELLRRGNLIALNLDNPIQMFIVVGLMFIIVNYALSRLATWIDGRSARRGAGRGVQAKVEEAGVGGGA